ncbi:hypothetical protein Kuura_059 [Caulobacter phage Kuura]|nr:hypothetical protein Kuura_059 [Caulobacter phage Kuura]
MGQKAIKSFRHLDDGATEYTLTTPRMTPTNARVTATAVIVWNARTCAAHVNDNTHMRSVNQGPGLFRRTYEGRSSRHRANAEDRALTAAIRLARYAGFRTLTVRYEETD